MTLGYNAFSYPFLQTNARLIINGEEVIFVRKRSRFEYIYPRFVYDLTIICLVGSQVSSTSHVLMYEESYNWN